MTYVLDSTALIAFLYGEPGADVAAVFNSSEAVNDL